MVNTRNIRNCFAAVLTLTVTAACGGDNDVTGTPSGQAQLIVENASSQIIYIVNYGLCTDATWGPDRLGSSEVIAAGAERAWTVTPGCYDVRARNGDLSSTTWYGIQISAGSTTRLKALSFSSMTVNEDRAALK